MATITTSKKYYIYSGLVGEDFREWLVKFEATLGVCNNSVALKIYIPKLRREFDAILADPDPKKKLSDKQKALLQHVDEAWYTL